MNLDKDLKDTVKYRNVSWAFFFFILKHAAYNQLGLKIFITNTLKGVNLH